MMCRWCELLKGRRWGPRACGGGGPVAEGRGLVVEGAVVRGAVVRGAVLRPTIQCPRGARDGQQSAWEEGGGRGRGSVLGSAEAWRLLVRQYAAATVCD